MTEHDSAGTEAAPTAAAESANETTVIPPATHAASGQAEAWSLDDTAEVEPSRRSNPLVWSALVGLVVVVTGTLIFLCTTLFGSHGSKPVEPSAKSAPSVSTAEPAPSTVTVTAAPPPPSAPSAASTTTAVAVLTATDQHFISVLDNMGIRYPDITYAISHARAVCDFMETHRGTAAQPSAFVENSTIWTGLNAVEFAEYARVNYCPQWASE